MIFEGKPLLQGSEQRDLFESVISSCKKVNPKDDIDFFVKQFNPSLAAHTWDLEEFNAVDCNHSEVRVSPRLCLLPP